MSLINKMLQDLDARGGAGAGAAMQSHVKSVAPIERRTPWTMIAAAAGLTLLVAGGAFAGWRYVRQAKPAPVVQPIAIARATPVVVAPAEMPAPLASAAVAAPVASTPTTVTKVAKDKPVALTRKQQRAVHVAPAANRKLPAASTPAAAAPALAATPPAASTGPNAEAVYRRALASLQEGRTVEAIALLEQSVAQDARHEAARQTLVGLLIENRRFDEAMRHMQAALALEPRQLSMAMLLARMQIERGGNGIDTLMRSLPFANGNGEYHAFLAGALQRQQRHREAAEQYLLALRGAPQQAVWLMGLGISLQAEKRDADALAAFQKAKAANTLPADLQAFVERKLQQLAP